LKLLGAWGDVVFKPLRY